MTNESKTAAKIQPWGSRDWLFVLLLVVAVISMYQPVWYAGFVWDDAGMVTNNPVIVGPLGFKDIWTTSAADICPLTITTFWIEYKLWGATALPFHLVNVFLHAACAVILWRVLMSLRIPGAWLGALLWAVHPVQVESVAWISELKNTQSCLLYLLSIFFFISFLRPLAKHLNMEPKERYALSIVFAALAIASKSSTLILPLVLLLCIWWMEILLTWRLVLRLAPIFFFSVVAGVVSIFTQKFHGSTDLQGMRSFLHRLVEAGDAFWFYLFKLIWPYPLVVVYPRSPINTGEFATYLLPVASLAFLVVLYVYRNRWARPLFFAIAYFSLALLPVIGLVNITFFRYASVADHFQYLASMGPLALIGAGIVFSTESVSKKPVWKSLVAACLVVPLAILGWQQAHIYENEETLWDYTLTYNPICPVGFNALGTYLLQNGRADDAMLEFEKALELYPDYADAHTKLAIILFRQGQIDEAIDHYRKALDADGKNDEALNNLGLALLQKGKAGDAIPNYRKAIEINPNNIDARNNLGNALLQMGQVSEAIVEFQKASDLMPGNVDTHYNLGVAYLQAKKTDDALAEFQRALEINPDDAQAHNNLGAIYFQKGQVDRAIEEFEAALKINPDYVSAKNNLVKAQALQQQQSNHQ